MEILSIFQGDKRTIDTNVKKKKKKDLEGSVRCTIYAERSQKETSYGSLM